MNLKTPLAAFCTLTIFAAQSALGQTSSIVAGTGDTTASSTVLIARLTAPGPAFTLLSTDPSFPTGQTQLSFDLVTDAGVPLKRTFDGLQAGTRYHYLVVDSTFVPALGTFVTPHEPGARHGLRFGASGDWQQAPGYAALSNVASAELDFFIKLGDTIYADTETPGLPGIGQARTLDDFRIKQNESISGRFGRNFMQSLYASTTLYQTIDDHELVDNFAGGALPSDSPDAEVLQIVEAASEFFEEHGIPPHPSNLMKTVLQRPRRARKATTTPARKRPTTPTSKPASKKRSQRTA